MTEHDHTPESIDAPKRHPGQVERSATRAGIQAGFSRAEASLPRTTIRGNPEWSDSPPERSGGRWRLV